MRHLRFYFILLLTLVLKSCEVPDVQPFIKATSAMGIAIDAGLKQVVADLGKVNIPDAPAAPAPTFKARQEETTKSRKNLARYSAELDSNARAFTNVAHAFDAYSSALDDVVASGKKRGDQIEKVSKTLVDLATAAKAYTGPVGIAIEPAITLLNTAINDVNQSHTIQELKELASPREDTLIQRTARLLHLGLEKFAIIDKKANDLVIDLQPQEDADLESLHRNALMTQTTAISRLKSIKLVETNLLKLAESRSPADLLKTKDLEANLGKLAEQDKYLDNRKLLAPQSQIVSACTKNRLAVPVSTVTTLFDALAQRKAFYTTWLTEPQKTQALYEALETRCTLPRLVSQ